MVNTARPVSVASAAVYFPNFEDVCRSHFCADGRGRVRVSQSRGEIRQVTVTNATSRIPELERRAEKNARKKRKHYFFFVWGRRVKA